MNDHRMLRGNLHAQDAVRAFGQRHDLFTIGQDDLTQRVFRIDAVDGQRQGTILQGCPAIVETLLPCFQGQADLFDGLELHGIFGTASGCVKLQRKPDLLPGGVAQLHDCRLVFLLSELHHEDTVFVGIVGGFLVDHVGIGIGNGQHRAVRMIKMVIDRRIGGYGYRRQPIRQLADIFRIGIGFRAGSRDGHSFRGAGGILILLVTARNVTADEATLTAHGTVATGGGFLRRLLGGLLSGFFRRLLSGLLRCRFR